MYRVKEASDKMGITLEFLRSHAKIDPDTETEILTQYIKTATAYGEAKVNYPILEEVLEFRFDSFSSEIYLIHGVTEIVSIQYDTSDTDDNTLDPADYELLDFDGQSSVKIETIPDDAKNVIIEVKAGELNPADINDNLKLGIAVKASELYANRSGGMKTSKAADYFFDLVTFDFAFTED